MKRIFLFIVTNLAVMLVLSVVASIVMSLLGPRYANMLNGGAYTGLLVMSAIFGFGGALISLAMSKFTAKHMMGVQVIEQPTTADEQWLVGTVRKLAEEAHIGMPQVGIFEQPSPNAFATGARRDAALVAVSTGLLARMNRQEVEAVLGHEISHVANGDMVTLTLIQGVVNTFVFFLARVIGSIVDSALSRGDERRGGGFGYMITVMVLQTVLGILASMIVMWFSRQREFRADAGGARLAGRNAMIAALERLKSAHGEPLPQKMAAFGISGDGGISRLFMSHPPLDERIAALRTNG